MKTTKLFRAISLLLVLALSLCACANTTGTEDPTQTSSQENTQATLPTYEAVENPITFFSLSMGEDYENIRQMNVYTNEDGTAYVEYVGDEKKVANLDANVFHGITAAFNASGLPELNGQDIYDEGEANASMYVEYSDGTMVAVGFSGQIPEAYRTGFAAMDAFFLELTASLPVYVPQPVLMGEIEEDLLNAMMELLNNSGIQELDSFTISQVAKDAYFTFTLGLSSDKGIAGGVSCAPMMITTAFSLVIVELEEGADAQAVCDDFENTMNWRRWVCVAPSSALIAQKGNMVLCLMAGGSLYTSIAVAAENAGWTEVKTLRNPDMQ
jgi:hypothetical protein